MAVCFQLSKKGADTFTPEKLSSVDNALCEYVGVAPDTDEYYREWVDIEGFYLAIGKSFEFIRETVDPSRRVIVDFLEKYYDVNSFSSR
jgi:hypothetical protein